MGAVTHLDLATPGLVLSLAIAAAVLVRVYAAHAERAARARTHRWIDEVRRSTRTGDRPRAVTAPTKDDTSS
jgi:hypothetical protein